MPDPPRPQSGAPLAPASLLRALHHLLRPLVRLLLAHQITQPLLSSLLKSVYVEVAEAELTRAGEAPTGSRLSLWTGIHRKDVRRLRQEARPDFAPPPSVSLGARLVLQWTGSPGFLDARGRPRALPFHHDSAREPSFESLVASVSTDIRPRAILDEWLRLGVVAEDAQGKVRLLADAFVPSKGFDEKAHYFGRNLHDHVAAAAHNMAGGTPPMLERSVYYDGLHPESVDELAELAEQAGMEALQSVNRRAMELQRRDASRDDSDRRIAFGAYFLRARRDPDPEPDHE